MSLTDEELEWIRIRKSAHGAMAEFRSPGALVAALKRALEAGYTRVDTFSPFAVDEVSRLLQHSEPKWIASLALIFGVLGAVMAFGWQAFDNARFYAMNVGGRRLFAWPAYVLVNLDTGIFCAVAAMFVGILWLGKLPRYYNPMFNIPEFSRASVDRFFLVILAEDHLFDLKKTSEFLESVGAEAVRLVPNVPLLEESS